jgi:dTDP-4-amino-4,6-dideoxy-D-galactose acyltransferase
MKLIPFQMHAQEVQENLTQNLPWSPHDFMWKSGISLAGDRSLWAEELTDPLPASDDLRFLLETQNNERLSIFCQRLPWDTDFFGYDIARLDGVFWLDAPYYRPHEDISEAVRLVVAEAKKRSIRYLLARVYPDDLALIRALCTAGFSLIETRGYYHRSLTDYAYEPRFDCRMATTEDIESLGHTAQSMVNLYDRFHADPFIDPVDSQRIMFEWVRASLADGFADVTIVPNAPQPTAFCTVKYHRDRWDRWGMKLSQPVFSAVSKEYRGWYLKIISEINYHLKDYGAEYCYLRTQITNKAVIRVWEKLGFLYGKGEHIFRIVL